MVTKQLVLKKISNYFLSSLVLLKDFDKTKLRITQHATGFEPTTTWLSVRL